MVVGAPLKTGYGPRKVRARTRRRRIGLRIGRSGYQNQTTECARHEHKAQAWADSRPARGPGVRAPPMKSAYEKKNEFR